MNQVNFGIGYIGAIPAGGGSPVGFGILKDVTLDYTRTHKGIRGQYRFDIDRAVHQEKLTGKATFAQISGAAALLAGVDQLCLGAGAIQRRGRDQAVMDDHIRARAQLQ